MAGSSEDNDTYLATLPQITVTAEILHDYVPKRHKNRKEFTKINQPIIDYVSKYTWMSPAQVYALLIMEQGSGSKLLTVHNNPFNITLGASKMNSVKADTWEYSIDNRTTGTFRSYTTIKKGLDDAIKLINGRYNREPTDNETACKHIYKKGWHTDPNVKARIILSNKYDNLNV